MTIANGVTAGVLGRALKELEKCTYYPFKVSAIVFKSGRIISTGHNSKRKAKSIHPKYWIYDSIHAEQSALTGIDWNKCKGASILVIRTNHSQSGALSMARPCVNCMNLIKKVGIKKIYYSNYQGEIVLEKMNKKQECFYEPI